MMALFRFHCLQIWRSRLLLLWFLFALFLQYASVQVLHSVSVHFEHGYSALSVTQIVLALSYVQFLGGTVLALAYGLWVVPYWHEQPLAPLTFALPVNKAAFPIVYAVNFLWLFGLQVLTLFVSLSIRFGLSVWWSGEIPWQGFFSAMVLSLLALETLVFLLAVVCLLHGRLSALMGTVALVLVLQVSAALFRAGIGVEGLWSRIYPFFLPIGEMVFDLKEPVFWRGVQGQHALVWLAWFLVLVFVFRMRLSRA